MRRTTTRRHARHVNHGPSYRASYRRHRPYRPIPTARPASRPHISVHLHDRYCGHNHQHIFEELYHEPRSYGVNDDFSDEARHIERGLRTGQLSYREGERLKRQLWEARELEREALWDGLLTHEEEADLYWAERELNQNIRREMNDYNRW